MTKIFMHRNLALAAVLLLCIGPALAQSEAPVPSSQQQQPTGTGGSGAAKPSPELRQARRAVRQACVQDIRSLCAGSEPGGGKIMMCIRSHGDQVSKDCKAALAHLRDVRRGA